MTWWISVYRPGGHRGRLWLPGQERFDAEWYLRDTPAGADAVTDTAVARS